MLNRNAYTLHTLRGRVTHVADGDTCDVSVAFGAFGLGKEILTIRFAGVDTPEVNKNEPFAVAAKTFIEHRILNKRVKVTVAKLKHSRQFVTGTHGRIIGVISRRGRCLNTELVKRGLAKVYPKVSCTWMSDRLWAALIRAEHAAKRRRRGVWGRGEKRRSWWPLWAGVVMGVVIVLVGIL